MAQADEQLGAQLRTLQTKLEGYTRPIALASYLDVDQDQLDRWIAGTEPIPTAVRFKLASKMTLDREDWRPYELPDPTVLDDAPPWAVAMFDVIVHGLRHVHQDLEIKATR